MGRLIDADALIKEIMDKMPVCAQRGVFRHFVDDAPTVDAVPVVRGEWEVVKGIFTPGGDPLLRCPKCKSRESEHMGGIEFPQNWNFCPKCGADMRKGNRPDAQIGGV